MTPTADDRPERGVLPPALRGALLELGVDPAAMQPKERRGRGSSLQLWHTENLVAVAAQDDRGRRANLLEVEGRQWAAGIPVATPAIRRYAPDGSWLIGEWIQSNHPVGADYVRSALAVADRIMAAPAPSFSQAVTSWRAERRGRLLRAVRVARAGLDPREFLAARDAAAALTDQATAHGDFYFRNVLAVPDGVRVVDWEFAARAPAFTDHLRFWSTTKSDADRELAMELLLSGRSRAERAHIGVLGRWLAYRLFAENVSAPRHLQTPADREHARRGLVGGRQLFVRTR